MACASSLRVEEAKPPSVSDSRHEELCGRCLSLPIYPELTGDQIGTVAQALRMVHA
jgi:dTDP-4-amino-4,6-dideoxygalactose transaminase